MTGSNKSKHSSVIIWAQYAQREML